MTFRRHFSGGLEHDQGGARIAAAGVGDCIKTLLVQVEVGAAEAALSVTQGTGEQKLQLFDWQRQELV